jgi:hypothetical protein
MWDKDTLRAFLALGFFIGLSGLIMLFFQPPNTPEFILSGCSAMIGGALVAGVLLLVRFQQRRG